MELRPSLAVGYLRYQAKTELTDMHPIQTQKSATRFSTARKTKLTRTSLVSFSKKNYELANIRAENQ